MRNGLFHVVAVVLGWERGGNETERGEIAKGYVNDGADSCAELSLTVPIVNTLAFLFTVIGEWWVEKKVISRGTSSHLAGCACG